MMCHRQFISGHERILPQWRPQCPECGKEMHIYMNKGAHIRYRCSAYPICKNYLVTTKDNRRDNELLHP
jgi:tRNA(Ile2) C34 agmatinyltransferase TiaS